MKIVADENIPFVKEAFGHLGDVVTMPGRRMTPRSLADADILLVRSVTKVDEKLLAESSVTFVGTATIGTDHIDLPYLKKRKIRFAAAPGSNAVSVAEYVTAAILILACRAPYRLKGKSIGVVGVGNVGTQVAARCKALGMKVLLNDPPLARKTGDSKYLPLGRIFKADFISVHAPLSYDGLDPTYQMINEAFVADMKPGSVLINTARGKIAETRALKRALDADLLSQVVVDVWESEPNPDPSLIERAALASPHIAGYGFDGKVRGTEMIYNAACRFLKKRPKWKMADALPPPPFPEITVDAAGRNDEDVIRDVVLTVCDIEADDCRFRDILKRKAPERPRFFDRLRRTYPVRREFANTLVTLKHPRKRLAATLRALGFRLA